MSKDDDRVKEDTQHTDERWCHCIFAGIESKNKKLVDGCEKHTNQVKA